MPVGPRELLLLFIYGMLHIASALPDSEDGSCAGGAPEVGALACARALRAPPAVALRGGEFEGTEFWDENEALLQEAWRELGQLHPYVYNPKPEQALTPSVARALAEPDPVEALLALTTETTVSGVYALELLSPSFCNDLQEELAHLRARSAAAPRDAHTFRIPMRTARLELTARRAPRSKIPMRRPNGMNRYGAILSDLGFRDGLLRLLATRVAAPLAQRLFPELVRAPEVEDYYGFSVRYEAAGGDTELAEHADAARARTSCSGCTVRAGGCACSRTRPRRDAARCWRARCGGAPERAPPHGPCSEHRQRLLY
jgi:hypothetical protein